MSAREALALAQGYWSGASTTGQNTTAAQTLYGMSQGNGSRWRKNRSGGGLGNGNMSRGTSTFYNILNVLLPFSEEKTTMILFHLDMKGIAVSRGSACQSGSAKPSHVLAEMLSDDDLKKPSLRISFSHYNTKDDIDYLVETLKSI